MFKNEKWYKLAQEKYDEKTFNHALRVMNYTREFLSIKYNGDINNGIFNSMLEDYCLVALLHDLIEDTDSKDYEELNKYVLNDYAIEAIKLLTKDKNESYNDYCKRIHDSNNFCAYIVKLMDIKDHLSLKDTLTDRLKKKYLEGLAELL